MKARESWHWRVAGLIPAANFVMAYAIDRPSKWVDLTLCGLYMWAMLRDEDI